MTSQPKRSQLYGPWCVYFAAEIPASPTQIEFQLIRNSTGCAKNQILTMAVKAHTIDMLAFRLNQNLYNISIHCELCNVCNKRLCYCRGTARRATSVEILWPFLTKLLTRSSANTQEPCEHTVSWNRVKCCTNVRRLACENVCNRWMTFKVIQGHCHCHHLIGHILFPISLPL